MEVIMQERNINDILFSLEKERFQNILSEKNWFKLQLEFRMNEVELSQSFLIWIEESGTTWLLTDFEHQKTYQIQDTQDTQDAQGNLLTEVSELSDSNEHLENIETICSRLQINPRTGQMSEGTQQGFIDLLQKLNLDEIDIEKLKRSNLSGSRLSFESVHPNLMVVYNMFRVILNLSREELINLPNGHLDNVKSYLPQLYEIAQKIDDFDISGENPTERHADLLKEVYDFCNEVKDSLSQTITYLKSSQIEQLEDRIKTTLSAAEERVNTAISSETERLQKIGDEGHQNEEKRQESFDQIYVQLQNQLAEKPISQYKEIFANQAKKHRYVAWGWLVVTGILAGGFAIIFWELLTDIGTVANQINQLSTILSNLFVRGFYISLIFLLLNRTIKNYTAEKHLDIINTHRQNALETFEAFADASGTGDTREQVLLAATKTIFDANQTGYLSPKTSSSDSTNPVRHFIKEYSPSKSSTDSN